MSLFWHPQIKDLVVMALNCMDFSANLLYRSGVIANQMRHENVTFIKILNDV